MKRCLHVLILFCASAVLCCTKPEVQGDSSRSLIDLSDATAVRARRPLLIAHRGGVVTARSPECSLAAIRSAARHGYDLVELDIQESADGVPVVFHDRTLQKACGLDQRVGELSAEELRKTKYLHVDETICDLDEALGLCKRLALGVMLDVKTRGSDTFFEHIASSIREHGLVGATMCINGDAVIREGLKSVALLRVLSDAVERVEDGESVALADSFWFGLPRDLPDGLINKLQRSGALVVPAINTFRYDTANHRESARRDIERLMQLGVDGFQIDSVYQDHFGRVAAAATEEK